MKTFFSYTTGFVLTIVVGLLPVFIAVVTDNLLWLFLYALYLVILIYLLFYPKENDNESWQENI